MKSSRGIFISVRNRLYLNLFNLIFFLIVAFTGLLIQIRYHMHGLNEAYQVAGFDKAAWSLLHKI